MSLPAGTVTFLFTEIEGSAALWEAFPDAMQSALTRHDAILRTAIEARNGVLVKSTGDGCLAAFHTAPDALAAALSLQLALKGFTLESADTSQRPIPTPQHPVRVRAALHTGAAERRDNDYFGATLNRTARLLAIGHGGQTLLSVATQELARDALPSSAALLSLGNHRLKDLQRPETVYQLTHPDLTQDFPPLRSLDNPSLPNNLPQQMTSFIGRETAVEEVKSLLQKTRLLTLTGSGGCGKTRLSLQAAAEMLDGKGDGVWFVELASLADAALLPQTAANVLGVTEQPGQPILQTLVGYLKTKRMLILLDNCEHLVNAAAQFADTLLKNCPNVTLLATSREALNITGETQRRVSSLSLPDTKQTQTIESLSQYEAARLFIARALQAQTSFAVTNKNAPTLAQLCVHLDGIPLAIELAAARVRSLSLEEINGRLDNRFGLLTGGPRAALPRQQTLRALIDWSYDLLDAQEKALLRRLSVFSGGWTLEAAEAVGPAPPTALPDTLAPRGAADASSALPVSDANESGKGAGGVGLEEWEILDLLTSLMDKSLVFVEVGAATRYRLLETVKQYAAEKLRESGEEEAARRQHLRRYLAWAEEADSRLMGPEQADWLGRLETEHDNIRAALAWAAEKPDSGEAGLRLAGALWRFWERRGHLSEGRTLLTRALTRAEDNVPARARANALSGAGGLAMRQDDYAAGKAFHEQALALRRAIGDQRGVAGSLGNLSVLALEMRDYATAETLFEEALQINRAMGNRAWEANNLLSMGNLAMERKDYPAATALFEQSRQICREIGNRSGEASNLLSLGSVAIGRGDYAEVQRRYADALVIFAALEDERTTAIVLEGFANLSARKAQPERSARLYGAAERLRESIGASLMPAMQEEHDRYVAGARATTDAAAFDAAWAEGDALALERAIELALETE